MSPSLHRRFPVRLLPLLLLLAALAGCGGAGDDRDATEPPPDSLGSDTADADALADGVVKPDGFDVPDTPTPDDTEVDAGPKGDLGAPCVGNDDCQSGYCIEGFEGSICTVICVDACPAGYSCRVVLDTFPDVVSLCIPDVIKLCAPCQADAQCFGGRCVPLEGGRYCASDCSGSACPASYACTSVAGDQGTADVCLPVSGGCECRAGKEGQLRSCTVQNEHGTCWGFEACGGDAGWQGCNAAVPLEESCDGVDNDCDGLVDEGMEPKPCARYVQGVGTCAGDEVCAGQAGWVCSARVPAPEACNHVDDDCDGATDEDFKTGDVYSAYQHCGACGVDCTGAVSNAAADHCDADRELPVCVVDGCEPPYFKLNEFQCILPPDTYCKACDADADCYGSACLALAGGRFCFKPCVDGTACADLVGAACLEAAGGSFCLPVNGTCDCDASVAGARKACDATNQVGTCLGFSTCDPGTGWGPCDARVPAVETCNGVDDDCNGLQDDSLAAQPCSAAVEGVGTCTGTASCFGSAGWVCSAPQPAVEACNLRDDDCDGQTDEDFRAPNGLYGLFEHCGACNASCAGVVANGTARCDAAGEVARCVVDACSPGYYRFGDATCVKATDTSCKPCSVDADCVVPGDRCLPTEDGSTCGLDCAEGNLHQLEAGTCPEDYVCAADPAPLAGSHCVPVTKSCTCTPQTPGATRVCSTVNAYGTCFGTRTCDTTTGWSACDAATPAVEVCNGVDDDCNGTVDDLPGVGSACARTAPGVGTCLGTRVCPADGPALVCSAREPAPEACNYADDDCDGATDEVFPTLYQSCYDGDGACRVYGYVVCLDDGSDARCSATAAAPGDEACNEQDDDCDGQTDEDWPDKNTGCTVGQGVCSAVGVRVCDAAAPLGPTVCNVKPGPSGNEFCNGKDDDCDGATDENWPLKGSSCTAGKGICAKAGVVVCNAAAPATTRCDAVAGTAAPVEACNLLDDTCDGTTDEDFVDGDGRYVRDTACGNCFTDCTAIYDLPAAYGVCDVALAVPACRLRCDAAAFDLNAIPDDGCEFALDPKAIYVSTTDAHADDLAGCGRGPWGTGVGNRPCKTIAAGLLEATTAVPARSQVLVADGLYAAGVFLADGIALKGGYRADTWERHVASTLTVVRAPATNGAVMTVSAKSLTKPTLLEGFVIQGQAAVTPGDSSYALWIADCGPGLTVTSNVIQGGNGAAGVAGARGDDGYDGVDGMEGEWTIETSTVSVTACLALATTPGNQGYEGNAWPVYCGTDNVSGGDGGGADCPKAQVRQSSGVAGESADSGPGTGGVSGDGGYDHTTTNCSTFPLTDQSPQGIDGVDGTGGAEGLAGTGCVDPDGTVEGNVWVGGAGGDATDGTSGGGGGGGGAGGGVDVTITCPDPKREDTLGGSGGGGGSGGCLGSGGKGGTAGGGSFAVFVSFTAPSAGLPVLTGNTIVRGYGGAGAAGGTGGVGGIRGLGAPGGQVYGDFSAYLGTGGAGGDGGPGGHGGGGGGGCGGPAYGLYVVNATTTPTWHTTNALAGGGTGGPGGAGGPSAGQSGTDGAAGGTGDRNY